MGLADMICSELDAQRIVQPHDEPPVTGLDAESLIDRSARESSYARSWGVSRNPRKRLWRNQLAGACWR
jgi:hypothetical protein